LGDVSTEPESTVKPDEEKQEEKPEEKPKEPEKKETDKDPAWYEKRIAKFTKQKYEMLERVKREEEARVKAETELKKFRDAQRDNEEKALDKLINAPEPDPENYTSEQAYYKDYALWAMRKENAERDKSRRVVEPEKTEVDISYVERERVKAKIINDGKSQYDDFEEVVLHNTSLSITPMMLDAMGEEDNAADIAHYFGKNPDIADKIARLSPISAAREIGKISILISKEESISQEPEPNIKKQTSAPAPITPIGGRSPVTKSLDKMTNEEYRAARGYTKRGMRKE